MKKTLFLPIFIVIIVAVALFGSPYYKLYTFKNAYEQGDYTPIIESVDFETLRPNLKSQLHTKLDKFLAENNLTQALGFLGVKPEQLHNYGVRFIDDAVDKAITPQGVRTLATGEITKDSEPFVVGVALMSGAVDVGQIVQSYFRTGDINQAIEEQKAQAIKKPDATGEKPKPVLRYCGFNCFAIDTEVKNQAISVQMTRHNWVDWRIDNVILMD